MSKSINRVEIIGHVGKDPELRSFQNGDMVANISVATSEEWTDKTSGEKKKNTEWHNVVAFGWVAKVIADFVRGGDKIRIEGKLKTEEWQTKDGEKRKTTKIYANDVMLLGGMAEKQKREPSAAPRQRAAAPAAQSADFDDDIPF